MERLELPLPLGGYDVMAACDLPKVDAWVRFPLPALPFEHEKHS